ncbi:DNA repair protein RecN [Desulfofalx alkaliphila]|uniref:DNA repair protein RecN n=1 Tax=Desulfofalx alkaliphila TaxID=105483 RepID=UPI0004E18A2C|nr:DNA repair protein RecN [Desulfofalx alkaliphila]
MLRSLYIKNFALIDDITVEFDSGLNILTGETGAGKSILLGALQVALGGRASAEYIRAGEDKAVVQAAFQVDTETEKDMGNLGIESSGDGVVVLAREISRNGRNWCRVNGQVVTLAMYRQAGAGLVDMHSQHQQQSLLNPERHLELLDSFGGEPLALQLEKVTNSYQSWFQAHQKLQRLQNNARDTAREIDMLQFQNDEIEKANLTPEEDIQLTNERNILANAEKITVLANTVKMSLYSGGGKYTSSAVDMMGEGLNALQQLKEYDASLEPLLQSLETALYTVEDVAREISGYLDGVEYQPQRLDLIEKRLDEINKLKRKYGDTVEEILAYRQKIVSRLEELTYSEEQIDILQEEVKEYHQQWVEQATALSNLRKEIAKKLEEQVSKELAGLDMANVDFKLGFEPLDGINAKGMDKVEFLISPNPGEPLKPLQKIASGGELSRFMLALKCVLAKVDKVPTLIFDEVDTGIGGRTLHSVGEKMAQIGSRHQVITVTHAPQVACFANNHYLISKEVENNRTYTRITKLDYQSRLNELARMLGGKDADSVALEHAQSLLNIANN